MNIVSKQLHRIQDQQTRNPPVEQDDANAGKANLVKLQVETCHVVKMLT